MVNTAKPSSEGQPLDQIKEIQELSLVLTAKNLNPTLLSVDFLKFSGIVPEDWELSNQPVFNPNFAQISFQNGVSVVAQPRTVTFIEMLGNQSSSTARIPEIASKFLEKLPHAEYQALSISPKTIIPFPQSPEAARQYITETLLAPGIWQDFGKAPMQAGLNCLYQLEDCQLSLNINEARLQLPDQRTIPAILFAGNFNYGTAQEDDQARLALCQKYLQSWQANLETFKELIQQRFLGQSRSIFPTNLG
jgi:hypothetical protein